jgi:putative peptidoglycan lipid II flippase
LTSPEPESGADHEGVLSRHVRLVSRTVLVSGLTLVSRLLGFLRETLAAALFGDSSAVFDAFVTAWRVPNLFRRFLGEGALATALQTRLTEIDADHGDAAGRLLFLRTVSLASGLSVVVCAVAMLVVASLPDVMPGTGWRWLGADPEPVRELTVQLLPFVVLICVSALVGGALNVRGHFALPSLAPAAMNLVWIATLCVLAMRAGLFGSEDGASRGAAGLEEQLEMARFLAWGVLVAGLVQLAIQVPALSRFGLLRRGGSERRPTMKGGAVRTGAWEVLRRSAPLALGAAVYQINVLVDGLMAEGLLPDGGPTAHYLGNRVQQFPLALIAVAATSAVFPALKALGHARKGGELRELHDRTQLAVAFLALAATAGLLVLARPIASALFQHGEYGAEGIERIAAVLRMLALALLPAGAVGLTSRAYYACGDFRTPVLVSVAMLVLNVGLNALFVIGREMDADGLALATAISSWGNLALLLPGLRGRLGLPASTQRWVRRLAPLVVAAVATGAAAWGVHAGLAARVPGPLALLAAIAAGGVAHFGSAALLRVPELRALRLRR